MKKIRIKTRKLVIIAVAALAVLLFTGCPVEDETTSISERIGQFMGDVNSDNYGNLWTHFHPASATYTAGRDANTWTPGTFSSGTDYTLGTLNISGSTVTTTISGGTFSSGALTFTMLEDGSDNWKIQSMSGVITRS